MLSTLPYAVRKRWKPLAKLGSTKHWLETHIFFGIAEADPRVSDLATRPQVNGLLDLGRYWS